MEDNPGTAIYLRAIAPVIIAYAFRIKPRRVYSGKLGGYADAIAWFRGPSDGQNSTIRLS